uniref:S phase cyclin A-associated protein in the endoplasmic reticulum N-terminal domain-containing protein n=1 Tax=Davidia involucrata TaxID=16924 RepID=A0A5B7ANZ2_DAVIN
MEGSGEADDDQGSGWLQVKKKHRSSSKFLLQGWVGGSSTKQASNFLRSQPSLNVKSGNSLGKCGGQPPKAGGDFAVHSQGSVGNSSSLSIEDEKGMHYFDKCVVSQDNECPKSPLLSKTRDVQELPQKDKPDVLQKIKWGDLDDGTLVIGAEIKFGDIGSDNFISGKAENANGLVSCISSCSDTEGNNLVAASLDADHVLHQTLSLSPRDESFEENCKEVNEVSSEDVKVQISNEKTTNPSGDISNCREMHCGRVMNNDPLGASSLSGENIFCAAIEEAGVMVQLPAPAVICEVGDPEISEVPIMNWGSSTVVISQDSDLLACEKNGPETPGESTLTASTEDLGGQQAGTLLNDLSKVQIMSGIGAGDAGESKERFRQRLWCFLFENLNRAVDELYLLCELECDLEQMKEAILVLEEAASDFKELNSRVEEFEKVKRSSSQLIDGAPITMKSDHRRPHALSWEVRRMTTSPHRAEILSSSLEAFRKIQQERISMWAANDAEKLGPDCSSRHHRTGGIMEKYAGRSDVMPNTKESIVKLRKQSGASDLTQGNLSGEKRNADSGKSSKINSVQNGRLRQQNPSTSDTDASRLPLKESFSASVTGKGKREQLGSASDMEKLIPKKDKMLTESMVEKNPKSVDHLKKQISLSERDKEKRNGTSWKSMDAWREKRNWGDILASPCRVSSRFSHSPGMSRRSAERARILHDKLMSPEKKKKTALDLKKEAEEKHARAMRIRGELENERVQKLQRTSEKLNRVNEWQAVRSMKLREGLYARHQRSESRHEAYLAQVVRRAGDESSKVNEVRFITSLNEENKKLMLRQKLHDSELRRAEKLQVMKTKQKEDMAREEAVLERKKLIEAEKLQRLAETQRKKEEAQVRREGERKASSAAREAKAIEQLRRKEFRAKAQQEEAELLAQKLAERLSESEQRRKFYLEQIRERASMDFRDQSSPLLRRSLNKESQVRSTPTNNVEDYLANISGSGGSTLPTGSVALQHSLKRRIKRIRQRLMALKYEFSEPPVGSENAGIGYRTAVGTARAKIGRWLQELQRLRQARKEGAASIGLITAEMIKFLEGKDPELQASRQAGLLDFIASALPASHTSKPEACQVTIYLLRLLRVVLSVPANRSYFLAQNLLPPIIPMLAAALENYIKIAASSNVPGSTNLLSSKTSVENLESISEVLDGFLWTVATIIGHISSDERQLQMQDGLQELVIAYHVIHRLRDLFALYDRPQVEGSPFPSSILLSINLLAVLTSRCITVSSIDWESFPIETVPGNKYQEAKLVEAADFRCSSTHNSSADYGTPLSALNSSITVPLPDVPEDRPLDESCKINRDDDSVTINKESAKVEFISTTIGIADIPDESQSIRIDDTAKSSVSQKDEKSSVDNVAEQKNKNKLCLKQPVALLLSAISETGLVCLPSLLTAVLLQANNRLSSEQASYVLPSNFEEVATGVLKVFNNLALIDITFMQRMLSRPDLKMEFFHLMSFLLSHCTSKWRVATDQIGLLLLESLLLLGYFSLFHPENQAVLRWGKSPTILHKVSDLPFVFFSDPELMPILAGTLVASCFGCEQNKGVVQQELSTDMLLSLVRSCKNGLPAVQSSSTLDSPPTDTSNESNQLGSESRKLHGDIPLRSTRYSLRSTRISSGKGGTSGNSAKVSKIRNQRDSKAMKLCEEMALKQNLSASETSSTLMLHSRFPVSFIDRAEQFFSAETINLSDEL